MLKAGEGRADGQAAIERAREEVRDKFAYQNRDEKGNFYYANKKYLIGLAEHKETERKDRTCFLLNIDRASFTGVTQQGDEYKFTFENTNIKAIVIKLMALGLAITAQDETSVTLTNDGYSNLAKLYGMPRARDLVKPVALDGLEPAAPEVTLSRDRQEYRKLVPLTGVRMLGDCAILEREPLPTTTRSKQSSPPEPRRT